MSDDPTFPRSPWGYLKRRRLQVFMGVILLLATGILGIRVVAPLLGAVFDELNIVDNPSANPAHTIPRLAIWLIVAAIALAVVRIGSRLLIFNSARIAEHDLRTDVFGHVLRFETGYLQQRPVGDLMTRLTSDVQTVRALWGPGLLNLFDTALKFTLALDLMIRISPSLTLWTMLPYPTIILLGRYFGRHVHRASRQVQEQTSELASDIHEDLANIQTVKSYGIEARQTASFSRVSQKLLARQMVVTKIRGMLPSVLHGIASLSTVVVLWVGGPMYLEHEISIGELFQFNIVLAMLLWPTLALGWMISLWQRGKASWQRLDELLRYQPRIQDGDLPQAPSNTTASTLEVRNLTLEYDGRKVLDDLSFTAQTGGLTAIVGPTGSGKSVLMNALPRLIAAPANTIFIDGVDIQRWPLAALRKTIAYAPQDSFLFSTTIAENIGIGIDHGVQARSPEAIEDACLAAGLARDLEALPTGDQTLVGERGITLSGGQRQRVALARAIASKARLLLLDDSLSSVDAQTEREILDGLGKYMEGRTTLLVSHRLAAVSRADRIIVIDDGHVVEQGTHSELLAKNGLYCELVTSQTKREAP